MKRHTVTHESGVLEPELYTPNPHFSDAINRNIIQSEIEGGVCLDRLAAGDRLVIETRDWICRLEYRGGDQVRISGHAVYCPEPVEVILCGSTWGGSLLKLHFIGRGMHMEFLHPVYGRVVTSRIEEIRQEENAI